VSLANTLSAKVPVQLGCNLDNRSMGGAGSTRGHSSARLHLVGNVGRAREATSLASKQLRSGKQIDDFRIGRGVGGSRGRQQAAPRK
jgi:hypothetical protein